MIELFWGSGSGPAWRVMLGLAHKGIAYEANQLQFSKGDTRSDWFKAINPRGKVPTIRDGDFVLNESMAILAWLDAKQPEPPMFGRTPAEVGQTWRYVFEHESHAKGAIDLVARPILFNGDLSGVEAAVGAVSDELALLERSAASGFLVGDGLSAADFVWYVAVRFLHRAVTRPRGAELDLGGLREPLATWPWLAAWAANVEALPGFYATVPPHWLESDPPSALRLG